MKLVSVIVLSSVLLQVGAAFADDMAKDGMSKDQMTKSQQQMMKDCMAKQDGYQLIRSVRSAGYSAEALPAIALTAFSRAQDRADAIKAGFQVHLIKPISADRLTTAISMLATQPNG